MYGTYEKENFNITKANLFNLILSTSFDYSSNIKKYFDIYLSIYDIMIINICFNLSLSSGTKIIVLDVESFSI